MSPGSRRCQKQTTANGAQVENEGLTELQLESEGHNLKSSFQVAQVTKPLYSVSRICDQGFEVLFTAKEAVVRTPQSHKVVGRWARQGSLYMSSMKLKPPSGRSVHNEAGFARQGPRD